MNKVLHLAIGPFRFVIQRLGRRYQVRYKFNKKHLVADTLLFLAVSFLIVTNFYINVIFTQWIISFGVKVKVEVSQVINGGETKITVSYNNTDRERAMDDVVLRLNLPENFKIKSVSDKSYDLETNTLKIGYLKPRANGQIEIKGEVWDNFGEVQEGNVHLSYIQESAVDKRISWSEEIINTFKYQVDSSLVGCSLTSPGVVVNESIFEAQINCYNNYSSSVNDLKVSILLGSGLTLVETSPDSLKSSFLLLGLVKAGEKKDYSLKVKADLDESSQSKASLGLEVYGRREKKILKLNEERVLSEVFYHHFSVTAKVNGQENYSPFPEEELEYTLYYQNQEKEKITNAFLLVDYADPVFVPGSFSSTAGDYDFINDHVVNYRLGDLAPGGSGELKLKLKTSNVIGGKSSPAYLRLRLLSQYSYSYQGENLKVEKEIFIDNLLSSGLELSALARYYTSEGEQLGIGPLPPLVGIPTKYRIFWQIENTFNPVGDVVVSGILPTNVSWTGQEVVSQGNNLSFDPKSRKISWSVGRLEAFSGTNNLPASANFSLELIPLKSQVGRAAFLLEEIKIQAADKSTGRLIEKTLPSISTNLEYDKRAVGKGTISSL